MKCKNRMCSNEVKRKDATYCSRPCSPYGYLSMESEYDVVKYKKRRRGSLYDREGRLFTPNELKVERKLLYRKMKQKLPHHTGFHYRQRLKTLFLMYKCVVCRDGMEMNPKQTALKLGVNEPWVYELLRKYEIARLEEIHKR